MSVRRCATIRLLRLLLLCRGYLQYGWYARDYVNKFKFDLLASYMRAVYFLFNWQFKFKVICCTVRGLLLTILGPAITSCITYVSNRVGCIAYRYQPMCVVLKLDDRDYGRLSHNYHRYGCKPVAVTSASVYTVTESFPGMIALTANE